MTLEFDVLKFFDRPTLENAMVLVCRRYRDIVRTNLAEAPFAPPRALAPVKRSCVKLRREDVDSQPNLEYTAKMTLEVDVFKFLDRRTLENAIVLVCRRYRDIVRAHFADAPRWEIGNAFVDLSRNCVELQCNVINPHADAAIYSERGWRVYALEDFHSLPKYLRVRSTIVSAWDNIPRELLAQTFGTLRQLCADYDIADIMLVFRCGSGQLVCECASKRDIIELLAAPHIYITPPCKRWERSALGSLLDCANLRDCAHLRLDIGQSPCQGEREVDEECGRIASWLHSGPAISPLVLNFHQPPVNRSLSVSAEYAEDVFPPLMRKLLEIFERATEKWTFRLEIWCKNSTHFPEGIPYLNEITNEELRVVRHEGSDNTVAFEFTRTPQTEDSFI